MEVLTLDELFEGDEDLLVKIKQYPNVCKNIIGVYRYVNIPGYIFSLGIFFLVVSREKDGAKVMQLLLEHYSKKLTYDEFIKELNLRNHNIYGTNSSYTPLTMAIGFNHIDTVNVILEFCKNQYFNNNIIDEIINSRTWMPYTEERGTPVELNTPLHTAIFIENADIVKTLIFYGANKEIINHDNKTALEYAKSFSKNNNQIIELLE